jgi:DNA-binding CsgD family transcriptional regulator/tetratricopeptide (TPR) repeat protein
MSLQRERLTALLAESALTSVELVIAPPGYGKTTILREYAATDSGAVFIALPEATDLEAFVRAVISAAVPSALHSIGGLFDGAGEQPIEQRAGDWLASRLRAFNGTLIIDDFHRSSADERVARVLVATIAATHGRMRWIVASRESPQFPMGSWVARGWMSLPLSSDDLSFTQDEATALAASLNIAVSDDAVAEIVDETLGWPIGVRLGLSLVARRRGIGQTRVQTRDALFALLDDEVWKPLDADSRRLIEAAALMPSPSINTLVGAGFATARDGMNHIFARVPFIQALDDDAFAIHDLFREFVATRSSRRAASSAGVATRLGSALLASGNPADGLRLLIDAENVDGVREALARYAFDLLETGQRSIVNAAIALLSTHGLADDGVVLAVRGAFSFSDGSGANAINLMARALNVNLPAHMRCEVTNRLATSYINRGEARAALDVLSPAISDPAFSIAERLDLRALHLTVRAVNGERDGIEHAVAEIESAVPSAPPGTQARILQRLAIAAYYIGEFDTAERLAHGAASLAIELSMDTLAASCYGTLYSIAIQGDANARRALSFLRAQASASERAANTALRTLALGAEFVLAAINADVHAAASIDAVLVTLGDARTYRTIFGVQTARAMLHVVSGNIKKAEATLVATSTTMTAAEQAFRDALLIVLMLIRGDRASAIGALERGLLTEAATDHDSLTRINCAHALRAVAFWMLDRPLQARRSFGFDAAQLPLRYRILVDALRQLTEFQHPLPNRGAIAALCRDLEDADFGAYATLVRRLVDRDANEIELSATEIETLRVFDRYGGRATDVAKALGKSKYTVQNQIQSAIKKIGCSGRAEALAYARQRGWLDTADS